MPGPPHRPPAFLDVFGRHIRGPGSLMEPGSQLGSILNYPVTLSVTPAPFPSAEWGPNHFPSAASSHEWTGNPKMTLGGHTETELSNNLFSILFRS